MITLNSIKPYRCFKYNFKVIFAIMLVRKKEIIKKRTISMVFIVSSVKNNYTNYIININVTMFKSDNLPLSE